MRLNAWIARLCACWIALLIMSGCGLLPNLPSITAPTNAPQPTAAAQPTVPAGALATQPAFPTQPAQPTIASQPNQPPITPKPGDLTEDEMTRFWQTSFAAYPYRLTEKNIAPPVDQRLYEAQSSDRVHYTRKWTYKSEINLEVFVIKPTVYIKATGDADWLKLQSLQNNQWVKRSADGDNFASEALVGANPLDASGRGLTLMKSWSDQAKEAKDQRMYSSKGTEPVNGVATNIYEHKWTLPGQNLTGRIWIGQKDGRVYKWEVGNSFNVIVEYNASIKVEPPIP